ncbi:tripartite motif-containing 13-like [Oratosquilla oratoria]|uniref:tripartite motif-containing 13-like n=1 Tax=Oratosquilla oratoria TaxID=337810 RepID=UPI003F767F70
MECPSCFKTFDKDRRPRVLSCGHSFCLSCLRKAHNLSGGVVSCFQCTKEEYYGDVDKIPTRDLTEEEEKPRSGNCPTHGGQVLSLWCTECRQDMCPACRPFHQDLKHQVVECSEARSLLLSKYSSGGQDFHECLVSVEAAIREVIKMAQSLMDPLGQTLTIVQRHIKETEDQNKVLERSSSLVAVEDLLQQKSRRWNRNRVALEMQMQDHMSSVGAFESSVKNLRRLLNKASNGSANIEETRTKRVVEPPGWMQCTIL